MFKYLQVRSQFRALGTKPGSEAESAQSANASEMPEIKIEALKVTTQRSSKRQKGVSKAVGFGVICVGVFTGCSVPLNQVSQEPSNLTASQSPLKANAAQVITSTPTPSVSVAPAASTGQTDSNTSTIGWSSVDFSPNPAPTSDLPTSPAPAPISDLANNDKNASVPNSNVADFISTNPAAGTEDAKPSSDFGSENGGIVVKMEGEENKNDFTVKNEAGQNFTIKTTNTSTGLSETKTYTRAQMLAGVQLQRLPGTYTIAVSNLNSQGTALSTDTKTVNVILGQNMTVTFALSYFKTETKAPLQLTPTVSTAGVPISISEQGKNNLAAMVTTLLIEQSQAGNKVRFTFGLTGGVTQLGVKPDASSSYFTNNVTGQNTYSFEHTYSVGTQTANGEIKLQSTNAGEVTTYPFTLTLPSTNTPSSPPPSSPPPGDVKPGGDQPPQTSFSNISWSTVSANLLLQDGFQSTVNNGQINIYGVFSAASAAALSLTTFQMTGLSSIPGNGSSETFAVSVNGKDYIGARTGSSGATTSQVYAYDSGTNTYGSANAWPHNGFYSSPAAAVDNDTIIVAGGASDPNLKPTNAVRRYNTTTGLWETLPSMIRARYGAAAASVDGKLFVFGGFGESGLEHSAEMLDLRNPSSGWMSLPTPLTARRLAKAVAIPGTTKIAIIGGMGGSSAHSSVEIFDTLARTYSLTNSLAYARYNHGAHYVNGKLIVFGGSSNSIGRIGQIEVGTLQ